MQPTGTGDIAHWLAYAQRALEKDELPLAESLASECLQRGGPIPAALMVAGAVAQRVGRPDLAQFCGEMTLAQEPGRADAAALVAWAKGAAAGWVPEWTRPASERFLIITAWGHGFWSDVDHVIGSLLLAEVTGRTPVVWWGPDSKYSDGAGGNAWTSFFEPLPGPRAEEVLERAVPGAVYPGKWTPERLRAGKFERHTTRPWPVTVALMNRPEPVVVADVHNAVAPLISWLPRGHRLSGRGLGEVYRDLWDRYIHPRAEVEASAERFVREVVRAGMDPGTPVLALHYRGSDKHLEDPTAAAVQGQYAAYVDQYVQAFPAGRILLLTDSAPAAEQYRARYGDRVVMPPATRTDAQVGLHFQDGHDKRTLGQEVLRDVLAALRCELFLGFAYSNVSCFIEVLKDWGPGDAMLLGQHVLSVSDAVMLMDPATKHRFAGLLPPT
jgi:protein O-GlcNAc transferase